MAEINQTQNLEAKPKTELHQEIADLERKLEEKKRLAEISGIEAPVEKEIFNRVSLLNKSKDKKTAVEELTNLLEILKKRGSDILFEMKRELAR